MKNLSPKQGFSRIVLLGLVFLVLVVIFLPGYVKLQKLKKINQDFEQRIKELEQANLKLQAEHKRLQEDLDYVEEIGRQDLGISRKGEVIYKVVEPEK